MGGFESLKIARVASEASPAPQPQRKNNNNGRRRKQKKSRGLQMCEICIKKVLHHIQVKLLWGTQFGTYYCIRSKFPMKIEKAYGF